MPEVQRRFRRGDMVYTTLFTERSVHGVVLRAARDGTWADVRWNTGVVEWTTRVRAQTLTLSTTARETAHVSR